MEKFGEYIKKLRKDANMTLRQLAGKLDVSAVYILDIEKGRKPAPRRELLEKLIEIFQIKEQINIDLFYDMAAKTKGKNVLPEDVKEMYEEFDKIPALIRILTRKNLKNSNLEEIIKEIETGKFKEGD